MDPVRKARARRPAPGFFGFLPMLLLFAILNGTRALGQEGGVVRSIVLHGNRSFTTDQVRGWMETKEGGPFRDSDVEGIVRGYSGEGYLFARVDSVSFLSTGDSDAVDLSIWIAEGKPAVVSTIQISGARAVPEHELLALLETAQGKRFSPGVLEQDIQTILRHYEDLGYPLAKASIQDITFQDEPDQVLSSITLSVDEGNRIRLSDIRIEGNTTTRANVILREARWRPGAIYQSGQPERIKRRLEKLQLFSSVSLPELYLNPPRGFFSRSVREIPIDSTASSATFLRRRPASPGT